jgi:hypothetical protein
MPIGKSPNPFLSVLLRPPRIVVAYILALFGTVAGMTAFPLSSIWLMLFTILVGGYFVVAGLVLVMVFVSVVVSIAFVTLVLCLAQFLYLRESVGNLVRYRPWFPNRTVETEGGDLGLWDRWIDEPL